MSTLQNPKLILKDVPVIFSHFNDPKFGNQLTLDVTNIELQNQITTWYAQNKIGKGEPIYRPYVNQEDNTQTTEFSIKLSPYCTIVDESDNEINMADASATTLPRGTVINLMARAYEYNNNFGKGISSSISAIVIKTKPTNQKSQDLAELKSL